MEDTIRAGALSHPDSARLVIGDEEETSSDDEFDPNETSDEESEDEDLSLDSFEN